MKIDLEAEDSQSSEDSGCAPRHCRTGKRKTGERARKPAKGHPHDSNPFVSSSDGNG